MRKEVIGNCELYCGDCLEIIPTLGEVNAVITDPPYSSGGFTRGDRTLQTAKKYQSTGLKKYFDSFSGDNRDQRSWIMWMSLWISATIRIASPGALFCLFTDWRQLPATTDALQSGGAVWRGIVVWDKKNGRPAPNRFKHQAEYIIWGTHGPHKLDTKDPNAVYLPGVFQVSAPASSIREHSTQKPLELLEYILPIVKPGALVLDPFMGSGTTGVACVKRDRRFIGVEIHEKYFDSACRRIESAQQQGQRAEMINE